MSDTTETPEIFRYPPAGRGELWTGEVATLAGVTPMTVTRWARSGRLEAAETVGGNRRYAFHHVRALLASLGRVIPPWLAAVPDPAANPAALRLAALDPGELSNLLSRLGAIEDWFRQDAEVRHADDAADTIREAYAILDDLADTLPAPEADPEAAP
jgi:hypothetical protein